MQKFSFVINMFFEDSRHIKVTGTEIKPTVAEAQQVLRQMRGIALVEFTVDVTPINPSGER